MSNPHKGDFPFEVNGKVYTLRFSHAALVKLEDKLNDGLMSIMKEMMDPAKMRIGRIVAILWAGLQKHHPQMTIDNCADLLDEIDGGASKAVEYIDRAFAKAFNINAETKGTNPPQREANGTGTPSSSSTSALGTSPTPSGKSPLAS